jgi:Protein of unknown function (DUF4058)
LPTFPVPLLSPDDDISLNIQAMIDQIYQRFRYPRSIDYWKALAPPLDATESVWLQKQLRIRSTGDKKT